MGGTYSDLELWQPSMDLVLRVYEMTRTFPKEETYCLTSQLRRAAVSIPSNIAEGKGRSSDKEVVQFLNQSRGSLFEIETQIMIATRLGYVEAQTSETILRQASRVGQLSNGLIRSLRSSSAA